MEQQFPVHRLVRSFFSPTSASQLSNHCSPTTARTHGAAMDLSTLYFRRQIGTTTSDVLGIDQGISVLMSENLRSGFVWSTFMNNPECVLAMQLVGFKVQS